MAAAARTPFESARRVFVIEGVDTMNDQAANRHAEDARGAAGVRAPGAADRPPRGRAADDRLALPAGALRSAAARSGSRERPARASSRERARACARLALGDARLAAAAGRRGGRGAARGRRGLRARRARRRDRRAPVDGAARGGAGRGRARRASASQERMADELELLPAKERKRHEREGAEARRRGERRARTRDARPRAAAWPSCGCATCCASCEGAPELIHAVDRRRGARAGRARARRRGARCARRSSWSATTRLSLAVNVSEELALEALAYARRSPPESAPWRGAAATGAERSHVGDRPEVRLEAVGLERQEA